MDSTIHQPEIGVNPEMASIGNHISDITVNSSHDTLQNVYVIEHEQHQLINEEDILQQLIQRAPIILKPKSDYGARCGSFVKESDLANRPVSNMAKGSKVDMPQGSESDMPQGSESDMPQGSESDMPKSPTLDASGFQANLVNGLASGNEFKNMTSEYDALMPSSKKEFSKRQDLEQLGSCDSKTELHKTSKYNRTSLFILTPPHQCKIASCSSSDLNRNKLKQILELAKLIETGQDLTKYVQAGKETHVKRNIDKNRCEKIKKKYICNLCEKRFKSVQTLEKHAVCHTEEYAKKNKATEILQKSSNAVDEICKESESHACKICQEEFHSEESMNKHLQIHKETQCNICNKKFTLPNHYAKHMVTHDEKHPCSCDKCGKLFKLSGNLSMHMKHCGKTPKKHTCRYCDRIFRSQSQCLDHQRIHSKERPFMCQKCFKSKQYAKQHEKIHSGCAPFKCDRCDKMCRTLSELKQHNQRHDAVFHHICAYCDKGFQVKRQLHEHLRTHTGEKPFACPHCQRAFALKRTLVVHLRTHTGYKPWICDYCGKKFPTSGRLKEHGRIHTGEKPYACTQCPKRFVQWQQLRAHNKTHQKPAEVIEEGMQSPAVQQMGYNLTTKNSLEATVNIESATCKTSGQASLELSPTLKPRTELNLSQIEKLFPLLHKSLASSSSVVTVPVSQSTTASVTIMDVNVTAQNSLASSLPVATVLECQSTSVPVTIDENDTTQNSLASSLPVATVLECQSTSEPVTIDENDTAQNSLASSLPLATVLECQSTSVPVTTDENDTTQNSLTSSLPLATVLECQSTSVPVTIDENVTTQNSLASSLPVATVLECQSTSVPVTIDENDTTQNTLASSLPVVTVPKSQSTSALATIEDSLNVTTQNSLASS